MSKVFDVTVIGAGAIGTSVAYHLAEKGYKVAIIDHGDIAHGSSSHCDAVALICDKKPGIDTKMGAASIEHYAELAEKFDYDFEFDRKGCLYVCETETEFEAASNYVAQQQRDGYELSMVDSKTLSDMEPYLAKDLLGGIWTPGDAAMSPYKVEICGVNTSKLPILNDEEKEKLFVQIKAGDKYAREKYIQGNLRLVLSVIKRFHNNNENVDDLFQI